MIDKLLEQRRKKDKEHRQDLEIDKPNIRRLINKYGEIIAFTISLMDQRSVAENDLSEILDNDFDLITQTLPIKKGGISNDIQQWDFEHNIFLEHLSASVLQNLSINQILEYSTANDKVKTKWRDILTHLLGLLNTSDNLYKELLDWLIKNDPELLINIENSHIPLDIREGIFKDIFREYHDKTIWIDTNQIKLDEFAYFGETKENVLYIFNEIKSNNNHWRQRANAALLLKHFEFIHFDATENNELAYSLKDVIMQIPLEEEHLIHYLIYTYPFNNSQCIDELITHFYNKSESIRYSVYHLIEENKRQDKYIDILINGIKLLEDNFGNNSFDTKTGIKRSLLELQEVSSYCKFFHFLSEDTNISYNWLSYDRDELKIIIKNSRKYYSSELLDSILNLYSKHCLDMKDRDTFLSFFEKESIRLDAINKLTSNIIACNDEDYQFFHSSVSLSSIIVEVDLPIIFEKITLKEFYLRAYWHNPKDTVISNEIKKYLKDRFNHEESIHTNANLLDDRKKAEFDILFDKEWFKKECLAIFESLETNVINPTQLLKGNYILEESYINLSIIQFLRNISDYNDKLTKENLTNLFEFENIFTDYLIYSILKKVKGFKSNIDKLSELQEEYISKWYFNNINDANFNIKFNQNDQSFSRNIKSEAIIFCLKTFNLECPEQKMLELLNNPHIEIEYVFERIIDKENLKNYTLHSNLSNTKTM